MGFDKEKIKQIRGLLIFAAGLVLLIIYSGSVVKGIGMFLSILAPFAAGGCIAFVLNLPMRAIEKNLPGRRWGKNTGMLKRGISLLLAFLFVVTVLSLFCNCDSEAAGKLYDDRSPDSCIYGKGA